MFDLLKRKNITTLAFGFIIGVGAFWYFQGETTEGISVVTKAILIVAIAGSLAVLTSPSKKK
jgi:hypothetical protein